MRISTAYPGYFYSEPLWEVVPRSHASGYRAAGSCFFVAVDQDFYSSISNSLAVEVDIPRYRYRYGDQGPVYSHDSYGVIPFIGVAQTSGGALITSGTDEDFLSPDLSTTYAGFIAGESGSPPVNTSINLRYYTGSPSPTTECVVAATITSQPATATDTESGEAFAPTRVRHTFSVSAATQTHMAGATWSTGGLLQVRTPHVESASLAYFNFSLYSPAKIYYGFIPNNESTADDGYEFIDNISTIAYSMPVTSGGDVSNSITATTFNLENFSGADTFDNSGGIFKGFVKRTAIGKTVADLTDDEIVVGVKMTNTTAECYINGAVVYDPVSEDGASIVTLGSNNASGQVGMGFCIGNELLFRNVAFSTSTSLTLQTYGVPAGKVLCNMVGSGGGGGIHSISLSLRTGDAIQFSAPSSGALPTGISANTTYYVTLARDEGDTAAYEEEIYKLAPSKVLLSTSPGAGYVDYTSAGTASGFYAGLTPSTGAVYPGEPSMMDVTAGEIRAGVETTVLFEMFSGQATQTISGVAGVPVAHRYRRALRATLDTTQCVFAVINDNNTNTGWNLGCTRTQPTSWAVGGHIHGHTVPVFDGFWQDETNCIEDPYGGTL